MELKTLIEYEKIILNKFEFLNHEASESFLEFIWEIELDDYGPSEGEVRFKKKNVANEVRNKLVNYILELPLDPYLKDEIKNFHFDVNKMTMGEFIPMHNEVGQRSPFEIILWFTQNDEYEGREFIMEHEGKRVLFKPKNGDICFLDTTQREVFHGVNPLLTDTEIISITGGLGRKSNVRSN